MRQRSNYTVSCKPIHGFTLIELLVVISIIALLLSILTPALQNVKRMAQGIVCQTNLKTLGIGWFMYHEDNNGYFVGADAWGNGQPTNPWPYVPSEEELWVQSPQTADRVMNMSYPSYENEKRGIMRGALYPFVEEMKVYHCPGDRRAKMYGSADGAYYRTYSIVGGVNGQWDLTAFLEITRAKQLKRPSEKYIMVEEADPIWNQGSWVIDARKGSWAWRDRPAMWHNNAAPLGFADGHSEMRKWRDKLTLKVCQGTATEAEKHQITADLEYMVKSFPHAEN